MDIEIHILVNSRSSAYIGCGRGASEWWEVDGEEVDGEEVDGGLMNWGMGRDVSVRSGGKYKTLIPRGGNAGSSDIRR